jgi:hypothetical protein
MNEAQHPESPAEVVGEPVARRLALGLVAAFVVVVFFSFIDKTGRKQLETTKETRMAPAATPPPARE